MRKIMIIVSLVTIFMMQWTQLTILACNKVNTPMSTWNHRLIGARQEYTYETFPGGKETLFLFRPVNHISDPLPLVVYIHGGGLYSGSAIIGNTLHAHDIFLSSLEKELLYHHIAFASVNYRLAPEYKWPAQLEDVRTAIRFLRGHANLLGVASDKIAVIGDSAGGELACFLGLTDALSDGTTGPWQGVGTHVKAVVDLFGPTNRAYFANKRALHFGNLDDPVYGQYTSATIQAESVLHYIHANAPPFLIIHGTEDPLVPVSQSITLCHSLLAYNNHAQLILVKNAMHEFYPKGPLHPSLAALSNTVARFFEDIFFSTQKKPALNGRDQHKELTDWKLHRQTLLPLLHDRAEQVAATPSLSPRRRQ